MLRRTTRLKVGYSAVVLAAILLVACEPILHPTRTQVANSTSGLTPLLVSGDGNYVLATSAGTDGVVPSAGLWRIRRSDHSAALVPGSFASRISRDGSRIQPFGGIWVDGTMRPYPPFSHIATAPDLDAVAYDDSTGTVRLYDPVHDTTTVVDPGPPPADAIATPIVWEVSDTGRIVHVLWPTAACAIDGFIDVPNGVTHNLPWHCEKYFGRNMSADGSTFIEATETTVQLVTTSGVAGRTYTVPAGYGWDRSLLSANGSVAWISIAHHEGIYVTDRRMVAVTSTGSRTIQVAPGQQITYEIGGFDVTPGGRFALVTMDTPGGSPTLGDTQVVDWVTGTVETLPKLEFGGLLAFGAGISDDARLVVARTGNGGWYEFTAAP